MSDWVEDEDGNMFRWPFCQVPGCPNRICRAKGEARFCWPHSGSGESVDQLIARFKKTPVASEPSL